MNTNTTIAVAGQLREGDVAIIYGRVVRITHVEDPRAQNIRFDYIEFDTTTNEYIHATRPALLDRNAPVTFL